MDVLQWFEHRNIDSSLFRSSSTVRPSLLVVKPPLLRFLLPTITTMYNGLSLFTSHGRYEVYWVQNSLLFNERHFSLRFMMSDNIYYRLIPTN